MDEQPKNQFGAVSGKFGEADMFRVMNALNTVIQYSHVTVISDRQEQTAMGILGSSFWDIMDEMLPYQDQDNPKKLKWQGGISQEDFAEVKDLYSDFPRLVKAFDVIESVIGNQGWKNFIQEQYSPDRMDEKRVKLTDSYFSSVENCPNVTISHSRRNNSQMMVDMRKMIEERIHDSTPHQVAVLQLNQS